MLSVGWGRQAAMHSSSCRCLQAEASRTPGKAAPGPLDMQCLAPPPRPEHRTLGELRVPGSPILIEQLCWGVSDCWMLYLIAGHLPWA